MLTTLVAGSRNTNIGSDCAVWRGSYLRPVLHSDSQYDYVVIRGMPRATVMTSGDTPTPFGRGRMYAERVCGGLQSGIGEQECKRLASATGDRSNPPASKSSMRPKAGSKPTMIDLINWGE